MNTLKLFLTRTVYAIGCFVLVAAAPLPLHGVIETDPNVAPRVAVIHLLFDGEIYDGQVVLARGYLGGSGTLSSLYPTREDFLMENETASILINEPRVHLFKDNCWNRFVAVKGTYTIIKVSGVPSIENVEYIDAYDFTGERISRGSCYEAEQKD